MEDSVPRSTVRENRKVKSVTLEGSMEKSMVVS